MKIFTCGACGQTVYFHNVACSRCGHLLGFVPEALSLAAFETAGEGLWRPVGSDLPPDVHRACGNYAEHAACNWMVPAADPHPLCRACRLNRTIPDLSVPGSLGLWQRLQMERNRLVYSVLRLRLPLQSRQEAPDTGLAFDFLASPDPNFREGGGVTIGHDHGVITLDIAEADDAVRERVRQDMAEPYRTVLGHFRHESGHFYWDRLVRNTPWLAAFRQRFGDERRDYQQSLARHYHRGPAPGWEAGFVSSYASSHPWEDWAETWAHYLHIVDTLETAWQFGLRLAPRVQESANLAVDAWFDPYVSDDFEQLIDYWQPVTAALNSLNHSMGQPDVYPFVLTPVVIDKLELVHHIIRQQAATAGCP
ncbi:MAG: putative zinc-binding metallopeptidase [Pseudomonadales bacterium]